MLVLKMCESKTLYLTKTPMALPVISRQFFSN